MFDSTRHGMEPGSPFMSMEILKGDPLSFIMGQGRMFM